MNILMFGPNGIKHNDSSKMSLDCARQIYKYAKSYPSVR